MSRHSSSRTSNAPSSRFTTSTGAAATAAVVLGVLMTLTNAGITRATLPPTPDSASNAPPPSSPRPAFPNSVSGSSVPPTSPMLSFTERTSNSSQSIPATLRDAGPSVNSFTEPRHDGASSASIVTGTKSQTSSLLYSPPTAPRQNRDRDRRSPRSEQKRGHLAKTTHRRFQHGVSGHTSHRFSRQSSGKQYNLVDSFEGSSFFDGWDFFDYADPTHGMITYVSADEAKSSNLAYVQDNGVAVMTVDAKSTLSPGSYRKSVRITSKKAYNKGLFVFDILRGPHGGLVWPAAWLVGPSWPNGGEIDVIEGVHENQYNQMTLHTSPGCTLDTSKAIAQGVVLAAGINPTQVFTGTALAADCDAAMNSNAGCGILDFDTRSYGAGLNNSGGGVFATLWNDDGVRIWFFPRDSVPADITAKSPDPSTWGSPKAFWSSDLCASSFFSDLSIVFDIVLGGDWAGATFSQARYPGTAADYIADPTNFANANWAVNYVRVYQ